MIFEIILNEYFYIEFFHVPILGTPGTTLYVKFMMAVLCDM